MSWFSDLFGGEDKTVQCGVGWFRLYRVPKNDPYIAVCTWDDGATTEGSPQQKAGVSADRLRRHFRDMIDENDRIAGRPLNGPLARFYKAMHGTFVGALLRMNSKVFEAMSEIGPEPEAMEKFVSASIKEAVKHLNELLDVAASLGLHVEINTFDVQTMNTLPRTTQVTARVLKIKEVE